jgi:predicted XRE-type DNA-binding protein
LELYGTEDRTILNKLAISQKIWEEVKLLVEKKELTDKEWATLIKKNEEFIKQHTKVVKLTRGSNDN